MREGYFGNLGCVLLGFCWGMELLRPAVAEVEREREWTLVLRLTVLSLVMMRCMHQLVIIW